MLSILQDKCFEERENLNLRIVEAINSAAEAWGVQVLRYEIKDITPPPAVKDAMDGQVSAWSSLVCCSVPVG